MFSVRSWSYESSGILLKLLLGALGHLLGAILQSCGTPGELLAAPQLLPK